MKLQKRFFAAFLVFHLILFTRPVYGMEESNIIPASQTIAQLEEITCSLSKTGKQEVIDPEFIPYLTEEEIVVITQQIQAYPIIEAIEAQFNNEQYSGMYYNDEGYLVVVLPLASYDLGDKNDLVLHQQQRLNEYVLIEYAQYPLNRLKSVYEQIGNEYMENKPMDTLYAVSYDVEENHVIVYMEMGDVELQEELKNKFGEDILQFVQSGPYYSLANPNATFEGMEEENGVKEEDTFPDTGLDPSDPDIFIPDCDLYSPTEREKVPVEEALALSLKTLIMLCSR